MKKQFSNIAVIAGFSLLVFCGLLITSCKKNETCHGTVLVRDSDYNVVPNAVVQLDAISHTSTIVYREKTDATGQVKFDVKLPAIFDVVATHPDYPNKYGKGVLNLDEPQKNNWVTVVLKY